MSPGLHLARVKMGTGIKPVIPVKARNVAGVVRAQHLRVPGRDIILL